MSASPCPRAGSGVHTWLLSEANRYRITGVTPDETANRLRAGSAHCGRSVKGREIQDAVRKAFNSSWQTGHSCRGWVKSAPTWPSICHERIAGILANGGGLADLFEASPIRADGDERHTEEIVSTLFPGDPLLCCALHNWRFDTRPRNEWQGELAELQLIVPSPMNARTGLTAEGKESKHSLDNTGPRRFLVVEFDNGTADQHAAILLHLAEYAPLCLAVHSGGKSLHGWFYVADSDEAKVHRFFRYAVSLGADPKLWGRSQFCRMPDGQRGNGQRQVVFFFNPFPIKAHE